MGKRMVVLAGLSLLFSSPVLASAAVTPRTQETAKPKPQETAKPKAPAVKEVKVPEKVLQTYAGVYQLDEQRTLTFTVDKGTLMGGPTGQDPRPMIAESNTKFAVTGAPIKLTFQKDAKGTVTGLLFDREGQPQRELKKIK